MCAAKQGMFTQSCETGSFYFNFSLEETPISQITQFWKEFERQPPKILPVYICKIILVVLVVVTTYRPP